MTKKVTKKDRGIALSDSHARESARVTKRTSGNTNKRVSAMARSVGSRVKTKQMLDARSYHSSISSADRNRTLEKVGSSG